MAASNYKNNHDMDILTIREQQNKRKGQLAGAVMFLFWVILLLMPLFWYQNPPPGQEGIQVNLGIPDIGMGEELNAPMATTTETEEISEPEPEPEPEPQPEVTPPPAPSKPEPEKRPTITTDDPAAIALKKKQAEETSQRKAKEEADRKVREEADRKAKAEADRKAKEAADRKAREDAARATKDQLGGLFNSGGGGGNTNKPGDGGAKDGDPNSSNIGTKSFGSGTVGGGLGNRGVSNSPRVEETSQKSGIVVITLCVLANGKVDPATVKFTQGGSTTTDPQLVAAATRNAKQWGFTAGSADKQCGTITYNFKVQ